MENTTAPKREKRPYTLKRLRTQDELWKAIVPLLWVPFLHFCMEDWVDKIDFTKKPVFLDKELKRLRLKAKAKNRAVDFLVRVHLKDGTTKTFLLHIEVQGYRDDKFGGRLYQYYYRIGDLLEEPVETLVIMIDDDPTFLPHEYRQSCGQTAVHFTFRMFKLLDNPPPYLGKEDNPFSVVFETAWYALKQNKLKTDEDLMNLKFSLIRRLIKNGNDSETIYAILEFINIYLPFANSKKELTFEREIESIIDNDNDMEALTIRQLYDRKIREDGVKLYKKEVRRHQKTESRMRETENLRQEEARMRQEEARMRQEKLAISVVKLHKQGFSPESIADVLLESLETVQEIIKRDPSV
jgi:hypothetical protein